MPFFHRFPALFCLTLALCTASCGPPDSLVRTTKSRVSSLRQANADTLLEHGAMMQKNSLLSQQMNRENTKRDEFTAKAKTSGETARVVAKFRKELEASVAEYTTAIADYKKKYLNQ